MRILLTIVLSAINKDMPIHPIPVLDAISTITIKPPILIILRLNSPPIVPLAILKMPGNPQILITTISMLVNGEHANIANDCIQCHQQGYANTPNTCAGCHIDDYNQTTNPDHPQAQFPTDCASCHSENAWEPADFDHNNIYALNGEHANIANDCIQCHQQGYANTPNTCAGCHIDDYNQTTNPDHPQAQFPTDCASCHSENAWEPADFDHNKYLRSKWRACEYC